MKQLFACFALAISFTGFSTTAQAQTTIGIAPRLGLNLASATYTGLQSANSSLATYKANDSPILAWQGGLTLTVASGSWAFQPSLVFSQKGLEQKASGDFDIFGTILHDELKVVHRINYLEVPLNVVYTFGGENGFQLFAGPYLAVGMGGRATVNETVTSADPNAPYWQSMAETVPITFGNEFKEPEPAPGSNSSFVAQVRRFDAGINAGVGYRQGPFQVQLGYGLGLLNVQPNYPAGYADSDDTGYHRVAQLTANYFFNLSK